MFQFYIVHFSLKPPDMVAVEDWYRFSILGTYSTGSLWAGDENSNRLHSFYTLLYTFAIGLILIIMFRIRADTLTILLLLFLQDIVSQDLIDFPLQFLKFLEIKNFNLHIDSMFHKILEYVNICNHRQDLIRYCFEKLFCSEDKEAFIKSVEKYSDNGILFNSCNYSKNFLEEIIDVFHC